ncbi:MAG: TonB-dependent receptor [Alphaproteobacteria bacterium]|nr:TonB-dependent receptor [Alphaproteobacteria bacterium]
MLSRTVPAFIRASDVAAHSLSTVTVLAFLMTGISGLDARANQTIEENNWDLSLEDLAKIKVTSVSKKPELETDAAAAIYVITQEDIRRSGSTTLPDILRMAPGVTVTQAAAGSWTVTARGSNDQFSNKLLVLMDGRTIYSPLFSGVIWDTQDTMLEDIDRIEVIRGPGATLWGANAVNGVINIITKNAKETQGGYASYTAGNQIQGIGSVRYGAKVSDNAYLRTYAKQSQYNSQYTTSGNSANDNWRKSQAGFRSDMELDSAHKLTVQGDIYAIDEDANFLIPDTTITSPFLRSREGIKAGGGNILTRYEHRHNDESQTTVQAYFDNTKYKTSFFNDLTNTADLDVQNVWTGWNNHEIVWGAGYRFISSENDPQSAQYSLTPQKRNDDLLSAFVQDRIALVEDELFLTLGSKFENNDYTGTEIQPSARFSWLIEDNQTLWGAVSRAVHTPYRFSDDGKQAVSAVDIGVPVFVEFVPNRALKSETMLSYELGYRIQPTKSLSVDVAAFYSEYDNLIFFRQGTPTTIIPLEASNDGTGKSSGIEISSKWNATNRWQLSGAYSYISEVFDRKNSAAFSFVGKTPKHQFNIRSTYEFEGGLELSNSFGYVDDLDGININGYYNLDTRISYPVSNAVELSIIGRNLLDDRRQEFKPFVYRSATEIGRSIYGSASVKF